MLDHRPCPTSATEALLAASAKLGRHDGDRLLALFEAQDRAVVAALARARPAIARLAGMMLGALAAGGRIIYAGAGTSGRLGALDAAEWGPTFGIAPGRVVAIVAGGEAALASAVEGAEDRGEDACAALARLEPSGLDLVAGISASGRTPFVLAALDQARAAKAQRALITAAPGAAPLVAADSLLQLVTLEVGPEIVAGSTRLQAAAATHMALGRASTLCALASGWIYAGRMVEMRPTNRKLRARAVRVVAELGGIDEDGARALLAAAADDIKVAVVAARRRVSIDEARRLVARAGRDLAAVDGFS